MLVATRWSIFFGSHWSPAGFWTFRQASTLASHWLEDFPDDQRQGKFTNKTPLTLSEESAASQPNFIIDQLYSNCDEQGQGPTKISH
jgi:hypothetical protein